MWLRSIPKELKLKSKAKPFLWCDNQSTVLMTANHILYSRTKHIEIDLFFVHEQVLKGNLEINHIPATYQRADTLTKALSAKNYIGFTPDLGIKQIENHSSYHRSYQSKTM